MQLPDALALPLRLVPVAVIELSARMLFRQVLAQHPSLFDRLGSHASKRFGFLPRDLDLAFAIDPWRRRLSVARRASAPRVDAAVSGSILTLLALLEGRIDGDAVFFSRELTITGDMEAMLALRNALDDCGIDLPRDLGAAAGPAGPAVTAVASRLRDVLLARKASPWS
jgi:O2-independent ubiquinone biosynthesis accessory factor UbiT